jgi:hypothetical protein
MDRPTAPPYVHDLLDAFLTGGPLNFSTHDVPADVRQRLEQAVACEQLGTVPVAAASETVVIVTPTIMDGTVVRWYRSLDTAQNRVEMASASRNGVMISGYVHDVPACVLAAAGRAWEQLRRGGPSDAVCQLATHRRSRGLFGPLEPVPSGVR